MIFRQVVGAWIEGVGQVGEGKLFGDPFDAKLKEPGNVVNDAEENSADDQAPRSRIFRTTTAWK